MSKRSRYLLFALVCLCAAPLCAQYTSVAGSLIHDASGNLLGQGQICAVGVNPATNAPIAFNVGSSSGLALPAPTACASVTAGVIASGFQVGDSNLTHPQFVAYLFTITDNVSGNPYTIGPTQVSCTITPTPSNCVSSVWSLDGYYPSVLPLALQQYGPAGPAGPAGAAGPTGPTGSGVMPSGVTSDGANGLDVTGAIAAGTVPLTTLPRSDQYFIALGDSMTAGTTEAPAIVSYYIASNIATFNITPRFPNLWAGENVDISGLTSTAGLAIDAAGVMPVLGGANAPVANSSGQMTQFSVAFTHVNTGSSGSPITDAGTANPSGYDYPTLLLAMPFFHNRVANTSAARYGSGFTAGTTTSYNLGVGGSSCEWEAANYTAWVHPYAPGGAITKTYFMFAGAHNSLTGTGMSTTTEGQPGTPGVAGIPDTDVDLRACLTGVWAAAEADGLTVIASTIPPSAAFTDSAEQYRQSVNASIRSAKGSGAYTYLFDWDTFVSNPNDQSILEDGTHPMPATYRMLATGINNMLSNGDWAFPYKAAVVNAGAVLGDVTAARNTAGSPGTYGCYWFGGASSLDTGTATIYLCRLGTSALTLNTALNIGGNLAPNATNTFYLGTAGAPWKSVYLGNATNYVSLNMAPLAATYEIAIPPAPTTTVMIPQSAAAVAGTFLSGLNGVTGAFTTASNAATATNLSTNGTANQVWGMDAGGSTQGWRTGSGGGSSGKAVVRGYCTGAATASATLIMYQLGGMTSAACTQTSYSTYGAAVIPTASTVTDLAVITGGAGINSSDGVFQVYNGSSALTGATCTLGTGTSCSVTGLSIAVTTPVLINVRFTTQTGTTIANVQASVSLTVQ
jgi:hypothetical protein